MSGPLAIDLPPANLRLPTPEEKQFRAVVERAAAALIDLLNTMDGDTDAELIDEREPSGDDEPELGSLEGHSQLFWSSGDVRADTEPSLGSLAMVDQRDWSKGGGDDLEDAHDGAEPSLGSREIMDARTFDQSNWSLGVGCAKSGADLEYDPAENEPSLASPENTLSQICWTKGSDEDLEEAYDGREPVDYMD